MIDLNDLEGPGYVVGPHMQVEGQMVLQIVKRGPDSFDQRVKFSFLVREAKPFTELANDRRRESAVALTLEQTKQLLESLKQLVQYATEEEQRNEERKSGS